MLKFEFLNNFMPNMIIFFCFVNKILNWFDGHEIETLVRVFKVLGLNLNECVYQCILYKCNI